jgi:hypothetical protein
MKIIGPIVNVDGVNKRMGIRRLTQRDVDAVWEIYADSDPDQLGEYSRYRAMMDTNICAKENAEFTGDINDSKETLVFLLDDRVVGINRAHLKDGVAYILNQALLPELRHQGLGTLFNHMLRKYGFDHLGITGVEFTSRQGKPAIEGFASQQGLVAAEQREGVTGEPLDVYRYTRAEHEARLANADAAAERNIHFEFNDD